MFLLFFSEWQRPIEAIVAYFTLKTSGPIYVRWISVVGNWGNKSFCSLSRRRKDAALLRVNNYTTTDSRKKQQTLMRTYDRDFHKLLYLANWRCSNLQSIIANNSTEKVLRNTAARAFIVTMTQNCSSRVSPYFNRICQWPTRFFRLPNCQSYLHMKITCFWALNTHLFKRGCSF